ncbi:RNA polymerase sigma factor [Thalassobacillus hwangdonensis]|uniref:RNA polymerase sigma factor n=1 Tax=Thalassobacillus hwangdonensis TaxID=546108 RepID=A0ABW3L5D8_9BACI
MKSDQSLLLRIARKDRQALEAVYDKYSPLVYRIVRNEIEDRELAERIVCQLFKDLWNRPQTFRKKKLSIAMVKKCQLLIKTFPTLKVVN